MRITCYDIRKNLETNNLDLVKEKNFNYEGKAMTNPSEIANFLAENVGTKTLTDERAHIIALNTSGKILGLFQIAQGSANAATVGIREIFMRLLTIDATGFIFTHNHPSGNSNPSAQDIKLTQKLKEAGDLMGIKMLDHIITTAEDYYSFKNNAVIF